MADVETTDAARGVRGLRFKKRTTTTTTTTTTRTENGVGKVEKKKEVVEETEKTKTKKAEEAVEKTGVKEDVGRKVELKEDTGKKKFELREGFGKKKMELKEEVSKKKIELKEDVGKKIELKEDVGKKKIELKEDVGKKKIELKEDVGKKKIELKEDVGKKKIELKEEVDKKNKKIEVKEEMENKKAEEEEEEENGVEDENTEEKKKKKKKKHRDSEDGERRKKRKKRDSEKENKKASYQKRDDILEKHVGPRVRSFDAAKMKSKFEKPKQVSQVSSECRQCGKQVFQMEKIVAEKAAWHKNCFRCKECNCILTLETYQSHEGVLYCKPHFKELFRPKVVLEDPDEARKERLLRRPKLIVLESQPESLPEGVVRSTNKPDYGLEDLSTADLKQKFKMFEQIATEEERTPDPIPVRRSQSLLNRAARFVQGDDEYGIENSELGEYEDYDEDEDDEEDEEEEEEEEGEEGDEEKLKKKSRSTSFTGMKDLKAGFARKNRQDELTKKRRQELAKFRQMLCAGKNITTREIFEGGHVDEQGKPLRKEQIKIEGQPDARNLRERFEKGLSITDDDLEDSPDKKEVDRVFKEAETASKARNLFKQIDKTVLEGGEVVMRPQSSAQARRENRLSRDGKRIRNFTSQVFEDDSNEEEEEDEKSSLADRFKFFATYEERAKEEGNKRRKKLFRFTPPPDGEDQGIEVEELELGRDPNLVKCTDNYEDAVDCRGTRKLLAKFRKMEMQTEDVDGDRGSRQRKQFTPPPEGEEYDSDEEYSDEYSDEDEEDSEEDSEDDSEGERKPKYRDEVLEMSAKKAASLRAKFEKWENEVERNNEYNQNNERYEDEEECMPSIDTARNLRAMFENKAQEASRPATDRPKIKVNRFV